MARVVIGRSPLVVTPSTFREPRWFPHPHGVLVDVPALAATGCMTGVVAMPRGMNVMFNDLVHQRVITFSGAHRACCGVFFRFSGPHEDVYLGPRADETKAEVTCMQCIAESAC